VFDSLFVVVVVLRHRWFALSVNLGPGCVLAVSETTGRRGVSDEEGRRRVVFMHRVRHRWLIGMTPISRVEQLVHVAVWVHHAFVLRHVLRVLLLVDEQLLLGHRVVELTRSLVQCFDVPNLVEEALDKFLVDLWLLFMTDGLHS